MSPDDAAKQIRSAVEALETNAGDEQRRAALKFLQGVPRSYSVALEEFKNALTSHSTEVRIEAACNLGKLGGQTHWVTPVLKEAFINEEDEFVRCGIAVAIGKLKNQAAATALTDLLDFELNRDLNSFALDSLCRGLESAGAMAIVELPRIEKIIDDLAKAKLELEYLPELLKNMRTEIIEKTNDAYISFVTQGCEAAAQYPLLGSDSISPTPNPSKIGKYSVIYDGRVGYISPVSGARATFKSDADFGHGAINPGERCEVRCVVIQREPGRLLCIAVWDHFSSSKLFNNFGSFVRGVAQTFPSERIQFGVFITTGRDSRLHEYTKVDTIFDTDRGEYLAKQWHPNKDLAQDLGASIRDIRSLFCKPPPFPAEFLNFIHGRNQDEIMKASFLENLRDSNQLSLDYSPLHSEFCDEVKEIIRSGEARPRAHAGVYADSFDSAKNEEFFASSLPDEIKNLMIQCKRITEMWRANPERVRQENEASLDWPDPADIPRAYRIAKRRRYEIEIAEKEGQIILDLDPLKHGVVAFRCKRDNCFYEVTNVPVSVCTSIYSYTWCEIGSYLFALNVLNCFVPPGLDGLEAVDGEPSARGLPYKTSASRTATELARSFESEFIRKLPIWGGAISADRIRNWIRNKLPFD